MSSPRDPRRLFDRPQAAYFVFACPKSGTTWLQRLLSAHPDALCTESRAFGDYYRDNPLSLPHITVEKYLHILSHYFAPAVEALAPANQAFHRALLFNVIDTLAATALAATGKRVYGEKITPYRTTALSAVHTLQAYNPDLKFVNLIRDGRDVIASGAANWLNLRLTRAPEQDRPRFARALDERTVLPEDFDLFLENWIDAVTAGLHARDLFPNYLFLSYERLLSDPAGQVRRLFEFLDLEASPGVVEACVTATSFAALSGGRDRGTEDRRSFFRKGVAGDGNNWLNAEQQAIFAERAGPLLAQVGGQA